MAKKKQRKREVSRPQQSTGGWQPNYWMIVALIVIFFSGGIMIKAFYSPSPGNVTPVSNVSSGSNVNSAKEGQVGLVAANFRCACGGCGELFLVDCTCDMPRGAVEEKEFIRDKLRQGLSVDQVIDLVEKEYGHRIS
jgi:cytochrome c-type biogenesis protein CcmH/NrfF